MFSQLLKCFKCKKKIAYIFPETIEQYEECFFYKIECYSCRTGIKPEVRKQQKKTGLANTYYMSKKGIREDIHPTYYFRSTTEANFARILDHLGVKWTYEAKTFRFSNCKSAPYSYKPDFEIVETNEKAISHGLIKGLYEIKGFLENKAITKLKRFKKYHPTQASKLIMVIQNKTDVEKVLDMGFRYRLYDYLEKEFKDILKDF